MNETDKVPAFLRELVIWRERERRKEGKKEGRSKEGMKENLPIYGERERERIYKCFEEKCRSVKGQTVVQKCM